MTSVPRLFADLAAALEDLHGIAVEGQHPDHPPDMQMALLTAVRRQMRCAHRIILDIGLELL